jgi:hypothetical protein
MKRVNNLTTALQYNMLAKRYGLNYKNPYGNSLYNIDWNAYKNYYNN